MGLVAFALVVAGLLIMTFARDRSVRAGGEADGASNRGQHRIVLLKESARK